MKAWKAIKILFQFLINFFSGEVKSIIAFERVLTDQEIQNIQEYIRGHRFMSRYHAGQKKEKVKKVRKAFVKAGCFI